VAYKNRPFSDYVDLIRLQERLGNNMGVIQHGADACTQMVNCISQEMREGLCKDILLKNKKFGLIVDESTSLSKKSCLVIYLRAFVVDKPSNIFLSLVELENQCANTICDAILSELSKNGFDKTYMQKNLVSFTSDGTSVMLGKKNGVGTQMKTMFPQIILWHCLNHRLELAVADAIDSVNGFSPMKSLFSKLHSIYSYSPKLTRELTGISNELGTSMKKIGKLLSTRWVASSYRTVSAVSNNYAALCEHFKELSTSASIKPIDRPVFKGLLNTLTTKEFVEDLAILRDCLGQFSTLSLELQERNLPIFKADQHIKWTVNSLKKTERRR